MRFLFCCVVFVPRLSQHKTNVVLVSLKQTTKMKKLFYSIVGAAMLFSVSAFAQSTVVTLIPGAVTNLNSAVPIVSAPLRVTQVLLQATTATNASIKFIDAPSTLTTYVLPAYTSVSKYATNLVISYTNYFGVVNTLTNLQLATVTNNVAQSTNNYPTLFSASSLASTTTTIDGANYFFGSGVLVTNVGTGTAAITISYEK